LARKVRLALNKKGAKLYTNFAATANVVGAISTASSAAIFAPESGIIVQLPFSQLVVQVALLVSQFRR
jgi:hypothetical protein